VKTLAVVAASGARTALGSTLTETAFLLRTGITAIGSAPLADAAGEPVTMCFDPTLDPYLTGEDRAAELAAPALREALGQLGEQVDTLNMRLVLCLDTPRAVAKGEATPGALLASRVHTRAREMAPGIPIEIVARGSASAAHALPRAFEGLYAQKLDAVILGGVHSDYDPRTIAALEFDKRLFSTQNLDALIPGEAAAFVILCREDAARRLGLSAAARIAGVGTAMDRSRPDNDESSFEALGLTAAVRAALADLATDGLRAGWAITDHTFESRRVFEWQTMMTRTHTLWGSPHHVESPAQRLGHLGAASLPLGMALAAEGWKRAWAPSAIAVCLAGSDGGERGAVALYSNV
jgi:3-oxoacyl-[acyl-carrier-protein] synthase I